MELACRGFEGKPNWSEGPAPSLAFTEYSSVCMNVGPEAGEGGGWRVGGGGRRAWVCIVAGEGEKGPVALELNFFVGTILGCKM